MINKKNFENRGFLGPLLALTILGGGVWFLGAYFGDKILEFVAGLAANIAAIMLPAVIFVFNIIANIAALIINVFIVLNPFSDINIAPLLWEFFKNLAYVVLVFLSLWAGFQFILNREEEARRLLIGILIVAFLINFTFVLAREFFMFFWVLTKNVLNIIGSNVSPTQNTSNFGEILYVTLAFFIGEDGQKLAENFVQELQSISAQQDILKIGNNELTQTFISLVVKMFFLVMAFIGVAVMSIFAGIAFGKFFIISFLVGTLPIVCIAYLLPSYRKYFDQWWHLFITWNVNILVLIILVMIGIFLFAATSEDNDSVKNLSNLFLGPDNQNPVLFGHLGPAGTNISQSLSIFLVLSLRFVIIAVYYVLIIYLALRLGGKFAEVGYNFAKWSWTKAGSLVYEQAKNIATGPLNRLGSGLNKVADKLAQYGGTGAYFAKKIRSTADTLQKPAKGRDKEVAETVWEAVKNKSPEEIAKAANRLKGGELNAFAELVSRNKSNDEIFKIFTNSPSLQKDARARRTLCERFQCAFDHLMKGTVEDRTKAAQLLGQNLDFIKTNTRDFDEFLKSQNISENERKNLIATLSDYLSDRNVRNFFSHPENLNILRNYNLQNILRQNNHIIRQTPTYRSFNESLERILDILEIRDENIRRSIKNDYLNKYLNGEITKSEVENWQQNRIIGSIQTKLGGELRRIEQINNNLQEQREQKIRDRNNINQRLNEKRQQIRDIQESIDQDSQRIRNIDDMLEGRVNILTIANETIEQARERLRREKENLQERIKELNQELIQEQNESERLTTQINDLNQEIDNLNSQWTTNQNTINSINENLKTLGNLTEDQIKNIENIISTLRTILDNPAGGLIRKRRVVEEEREDIEELIREQIRRQQEGGE
ncbi:MAG: hypothetical protein NZ866_02365 [Patescibacteria group bacterium]|nr:hypothetical protein [Patescibacteria group bacterium]